MVNSLALASRYKTADNPEASTKITVRMMRGEKN
jgi:hypothetical protein